MPISPKAEQMAEEQGKICQQIKCIFWGEYWDEENNCYYDRCGAVYDAPKEFIPEHCPLQETKSNPIK